jgi:hypothetical protein
MHSSRRASSTSMPSAPRHDTPVSRLTPGPTARLGRRPRRRATCTCVATSNTASASRGAPNPNNKTINSAFLLQYKWAPKGDSGGQTNENDGTAGATDARGGMHCASAAEVEWMVAAAPSARTVRCVFFFFFFFFWADSPRRAGEKRNNTTTCLFTRPGWRSAEIYARSAKTRERRSAVAGVREWTLEWGEGAELDAH